MNDQVLEFGAKDLGLFGVHEVAVLDAPVRDRAGDAMDELLDRVFALGLGRIAVKIFGADDLGREHRPGFGHLDPLLLEDHLATVIGDFGDAAFPFDLVERRNLCIAEHAAQLQCGGRTPGAGGFGRGSASSGG